MKISRRKNRIKRHARVRAKIKGTTSVPRISVFRSNKHIFVQIINDVTGKTLVSSIVKPKEKTKLKGTKIEIAGKIGKMVAEKARGAGISKVIFDRGGYKYHGRIRALADGLRRGGLQF